MFKKGDQLTYNIGTADIRARVETAHRDGSVTVTALFYQDKGEDVPGYLGFKYRLWPGDPQVQPDCPLPAQSNSISTN